MELIPVSLFNLRVSLDLQRRHGSDSGTVTPRGFRFVRQKDGVKVEEMNIYWDQFNEQFVSKERY